MADWIKMRVNLDTDPRVIEVAAKLGVSELHVVGLLWKVWSWADQHSLDGNALRVTDETLDRFTNTPGFCLALRNVGWLEGRGNALSFPRFAEHNGQTAKNRAVTHKRVTKHRNGASVTDVTVSPLPEEKRRESNIQPPKRGRQEPSEEECIAHAQTRYAKDKEFAASVGRKFHGLFAVKKWTTNNGDDLLEGKAWKHRLNAMLEDEVRGALTKGAGTKGPQTEGRGW